MVTKHSLDVTLHIFHILNVDVYDNIYLSYFGFLYILNLQDVLKDYINFLY